MTTTTTCPRRSRSTAYAGAARRRTRLEIGGSAIELVGIRFWTKRQSDLAALTTNCEATPVILLAHDPRRLAEAAALDVPLVLSGHTHGGQVVLPGVGAVAARKFPVIAGLARQDKHHAVREPRRGDGLRADRVELSSGGRAAYTPLGEPSRHV